MKKGIFFLILGAILLGGTTGWIFVSDNSKLLPRQSPTPTPLSTIPDPITYKGAQGKTVLELLKTGHKVTEETAEYGNYITSIDGIASTNQYYWAFYINGAPALARAEATTTKESDTIEWKYEKIK